MMRPEDHIFRKPLARYAVAVIAIILFSLAVGKGLLSSGARLSDFAGYYTAAAVVAHRDSVSHMYDDPWFKDQVKRLGLQDTGMVMYVNPPPVSLVMLPLVWLEPFQAKVFWNLCTFALLFVAWLLAMQCFGVSWRSFYGVVLFGLLASTVPFLRNLQRGQLYIVLLLLVVILWRALLRKNPWHAGIALSLLLLLKYFGWMFLPLLALQRKWREVLITLCCVIAGTALTMGIVGPETYMAHFARLWSSFSTQDAFVTGLPCVPAFFGKLFVYHPLWNLSPVLDAPWLATLLTAGTLAVMLGFSLKRSARSFVQSFYLLIVVSVLFTPLAAEHHFVLLSIPFFTGILNMRPESGSLRQLFALSALAYMIFGWFPPVPPNMFGGWMELLAFPRLYGGAILWLLLLNQEPYPLIPYEKTVAA